MSEIEKLRDKAQEIQFALSGGVSFTEAMNLAARLKELEHQIILMEAGKPREEPPPYAPGGRATEMGRPKCDLSSPHGNGHDPLKVVEKLWTR